VGYRLLTERQLTAAYLFAVDYGMAAGRKAGAMAAEDAPPSATRRPGSAAERNGYRLPVKLLLVAMLCFLRFAEGRARVPKLAEPVDWNGLCDGGRCVMPNNTWLVITKQRSGSRWLVDTMATRTGGLVPDGPELRCSGCHCGQHLDMASQTGAAAAAECSCALRQSYSKASPSCSAPTDRHVGFKFMVPHSDGALQDGAFDVLARAVCHLNIPVVFMWRRNVLRRMVSSLANYHDARNPALKPDETDHVVSQSRRGKQAGHEPHPVDPRAAAKLAEYKPDINPTKVLSEVEKEERTRRVIEHSFRKYASMCEVARNAKTFYYEDLVDGAPGAAAQWGELLSTLKVWKNSELAVIHGQQHVRDTISNARSVRKALKDTPYSWMIEE